MKPDLVQYRVTVRDTRTGTIIGVLRNISEPHCTIPAEWLTRPDDTAMRVEVADVLPDGSTGEWVTWMPYFLLGRPTEAEVWLDSPVLSDGFPLRLIVRDARGDKVLSDQTRREGPFPLVGGLASRGAQLLYNFVRYHHPTKSWIDLARPKPLPYGSNDAAGSKDVLPAKRSDSPTGNSIHADPRLFFFTVDVEINMRYQRLPDPHTAVDEHIFGITPGGGSQEYGIRYIMDALDSRGMKGTFFVDVLMEYQVGEKGLRCTIDAILERGHDVQLHLHPNPNLYFAADKAIQNIGVAYAMTRSRDAFREAMDLAVPLFEKRCGYVPVAFRNGSYVLRDEYFDVMKEFGIRFDSSLYAYKNNETSSWIRGRTSPFRHRTGIVELPVTWAIQRSQQGTTTFQHSVGVGRQGDRIDDSMRAFWERSDGPLVTLIHSFSFLMTHRNRPDEERVAWNDRLRALVDEGWYRNLYLDEPKKTMDGPDLRRLTALDARLDMVAQDARVRTSTFADLLNIPSGHLVRDAVVDPIIEYDTTLGIPRMIGLQRYSSSYLEYLDAQGGVDCV